ncbi:DNA-binding protein [Pasteurellaceae bacterium USgator11]|nr:DNA-binding protein [Pasteurellaceae bacterium USgator41]TNG98692.1 DNA-binding protein [Pasteurellaceae bacterium UScroc31]TNH00059.1 DNA-binding protein [Pasteurellaceae bacterium USgator11]
MKIKTPQQVKDELVRQGITIKKWAETHGYDPRFVYVVLDGRIKGNRGKSHEIAVKLGLKAAA